MLLSGNKGKPMTDNVTPMPGKKSHEECEKFRNCFDAQIITKDDLIVLSYQNMIMAFPAQAAIKAGEALMDAGINLLKTTPEKENE
jgi:hypothetical protein